MQTNRAVCCFYALTGQFDERGSNVLFATTPTNPITGRELLPEAQADRRLRIAQHPLGPPTDPGLVQAAAVYRPFSLGGRIRLRLWCYSAVIHCSDTAIRSTAKPRWKRWISTSTLTLR